MRSDWTHFVLYFYSKLAFLQVNRIPGIRPALFNPSIRTPQPSQHNTSSQKTIIRIVWLYIAYQASLLLASSLLISPAL